LIQVFVTTVLRLLPAATADPDAPDTALGDWYVNRITCDRQPLLLLVSSTSLLPLLAPAREVRALPERLAPLVAARLVRLGVPARLIEAETQAMAPVAVARTIDRSVVGTMVDFGRVLAYYLRGWAQDESVLWQAEARLARTPCRPACLPACLSPTRGRGVPAGSAHLPLNDLIMFNI
jgi:hypothetical protein